MTNNYLTIIGDTDIPKSEKVLCRCVCGVEKLVGYGRVKNNVTTSCGCKGLGDIPNEVKRTFSLMKYRCETETSPDYGSWGAKGIMVVYKDVREFYEDVGNKPSKAHSIDRINSKGNYETGNCRWATQEEQANNTGSNRPLEYNGVVKNLSQWAREKGILPTTIRYRLDNGMSVEEALDTKIDKMKSKAGKVSQELRRNNG